MIPFKETITSKDELINACREGYQGFVDGKISKNDFCMFFGFTHGEAITKFYDGQYGQLLIDGGFNSGSEAYFHGGINAWRNLRDGKYTFPPIKELSTNAPDNIDSPAKQTIFFGSPGTGKSHKVKQFLKDIPEDRVFRTTFHPDCDYSTFVGCYKPSMDGDKIRYEFEPQIFTKAYISAWNDSTTPVFMVIEEINRGNCAQVFGDLFQLLDRDKTGYSEYPVQADEALKQYLMVNAPESITNGQLRLPPNFNILATMNTSDQSLFPMDSAFKRRWAWEYVPIDPDCPDSQFKITIGDKSYKWSSFLVKVNERIHNLSDSEDKQLGNFFIKSDIDVEEFKSKIMFYLWSEVCKEYEKSGSFFKDEKDVEFTFNSLFPTNEETDRRLQGFMSYLGVEEV